MPLIYLCKVTAILNTGEAFLFLYFHFHNFGPKKAYPCAFLFLNAMYLQTGNKPFHAAFSRQEHNVTMEVSPGSVGFSHPFYDTLICA